MQQVRQAWEGTGRSATDSQTDTEISSALTRPQPGRSRHRIRAGDESAWRDLSDRYEPLLRWLARQHGLSAEDASDVVQLTWLRCLEHIDQLTHKDRLGGWLATICRRECMRLATKGRREVPLGGPDMGIAEARREGVGSVRRGRPQ